MTSEKKKQKIKNHTSKPLEIRIPRVQEMQQLPTERERKVKISHLLTQKEVPSQDPKPVVNDEIKKRLSVCHEKLLKNNEILAKAADSLKTLNLGKLRRQIEDNRILDTAQCLLQDEEELKQNQIQIQKELDEFRQGKKEKVVKQQSSPLQDLNDSLKDIVETFNKITEQLSKQ